MSTFKFAAKNRKQLALAISKILNQRLEYMGAPGFQYRIGDYVVEKDGTLEGEYDLNLFVGLAERGFEPQIPPVLPEEPQAGEIPEALPEAAQTAASGEPDRLTIEFPRDSFSDEAIENLHHMVAAKEPLIKLALGTDELPIVITESTVQFPWFRLENSENAAFYTQFIFALCKTAKEKKRVTAGAREFPNPKFSFRVWLIGLGMVGREYSAARKLLCKPLPGNSAWQSGVDPRKKRTE